MTLLSLLPLMLACAPHEVSPGTIGVLTEWGELDENSYPEGFYWEIIGEDYFNYDTRVQKMEAQASASSKDLQVVASTIVLNFRIDPTHVVKLFREMGTLEMISNTIIAPALQEAVKTVTAQYTAEELITRRSEVKNGIQEVISTTLSSSYLVVTDLSIVNFKFDDKYQAAVEAKQVAEEKAKQATNDLKRIEIEAKQAEAEAQGKANAMLVQARAEAEAQELLRSTLTEDIIQLRAIEKWNGIMPLVSGDGGSSFVDVAALAGRK